VVFSFFFFLNYSLVSSHGTGVSYEETKDGFKIDIGHDEFIAAEESTRFDFALYPENLDTIEGEVFTDVWVTFTKDKKIFFAGGINKPVFGTTGFTYVFPKEGVYTVSARFQKYGETVVKTEFPITIIAPLDLVEPTSSFLFPIVFGGFGFLIGIIFTVVIRKLVIKK
jgi:hypothetical protein